MQKELPRRLKLTKMEREVLCTGGLTSKLAGQLLYISDTTIRTHKSNLFKKLKVNNMTQAVIKALRMKLVKLEELR